MLEKAILKRADRFMFTEHNSGNGYLNGKNDAGGNVFSYQ